MEPEFIRERKITISVKDIKNYISKLDNSKLEEKAMSKVLVKLIAGLLVYTEHSIVEKTVNIETFNDLIEEVNNRRMKMIEVQRPLVEDNQYGQNNFIISILKTKIDTYEEIMNYLGVLEQK